MMLMSLSDNTDKESTAMIEKGKTTILVVDDETYICSLISKILMEEYSVIKAQDGRTTLELARRNKPDLILLDIMMPGMDGYTVLATLKADKSTRDIPVVMISAVDHKLNMILSQNIGARDFLNKPFTADELKRVIRDNLQVCV